MNFGLKHGQKLKNNENNLFDTESVASAITKGNVGINPFYETSKSFKTRNLSINQTYYEKSNQNRFSNSFHNENKKQYYDMGSGGDQFNSSERKITQNSKILTSGNGLNDNMIDETYSTCDMPNSLKSAHLNMIKVYLQTPYKMLINKKFRNKNQPQDKLFRADNLLSLHTQYRCHG